MNHPPLKDIEYMASHLFNASQPTTFYRAFFGFDIISYLGSEAWRKGQISYLLLQRFIRLVISSAINTDSFSLKHASINRDKFLKLALEGKAPLLPESAFLIGKNQDRQNFHALFFGFCPKKLIEVGTKNLVHIIHRYIK